MAPLNSVMAARGGRCSHVTKPAAASRAAGRRRCHRRGCYRGTEPRATRGYRIAGAAAEPERSERPSIVVARESATYCWPSSKVFAGSNLTCFNPMP